MEPRGGSDPGFWAEVSVRSGQRRPYAGSDRRPREGPPARTRVGPAAIRLREGAVGTVRPSALRRNRSPRTARRVPADSRRGPSLGRALPRAEPLVRWPAAPTRGPPDRPPEFVRPGSTSGSSPPWLPRRTASASRRHREAAASWPPRAAISVRRARPLPDRRPPACSAPWTPLATSLPVSDSPHITHDTISGSVYRQNLDPACAADVLPRVTIEKRGRTPPHTDDDSGGGLVVCPLPELELPSFDYVERIPVRIREGHVIETLSCRLDHRRPKSQ